MQIIPYKTILDTQTLDSFFERPCLKIKDQVLKTVKSIFASVEEKGDQAVRAFTRQYDHIELDKIKYLCSAFNHSDLTNKEKKAIHYAIKNISCFHQAIKPIPVKVETRPGINCQQIWRALDCIGLYIPAGNAALISTLLMLVIPAQLAGVKNIILMTPPQSKGNLVHPAIIYTCQILGLNHIFLAGGAQAIAAMTFGTKTIPKVDKIFGPGNQWVDCAKRYAITLPSAPLIDLPAGPSEVMIVADEKANPDFIASDLLAQAEHDPLAQVILVCFSHAFAQNIILKMNQQIRTLNRKTIIKQALLSAKSVIVDHINQAIKLANFYAPEHLILNLEHAELLIPKIHHAGSIFIGAYTPESAGDYASGTNHVLPTNKEARRYSGLSTQSFMKSMTVQSISPEGLLDLGPIVKTLAQIEGLDAHAHSISVRLKTIRSSLK